MIPLMIRLVANSILNHLTILFQHQTSNRQVVKFKIRFKQTGMFFSFNVTLVVIFLGLITKFFGNFLWKTYKLYKLNLPSISDAYPILGVIPNLIFNTHQGRSFLYF